MAKIQSAMITATLLCLAMVCSANTDNLKADNSKADNKKRDFKLTVIVLTMNRPKSLARLLKSLDATDFEFPEDYFDVEIHVDKSIGAHYDDCVRYVARSLARYKRRLSRVF